MSLDRFFLRGDGDYSAEVLPVPTDRLVDTRIYTASGVSHDLAILFPSWHMPPDHPVVLRFARQATARGTAVICFGTNGSILSSDVQATLDSHQRACAQIIGETNSFIEQNEPSSVFVMASSLGSALGSLCVGNGLPADRLRLVTPSNSLAAAMWTGTRTQHLRAAMEANGIDLQALEAQWTELAPQSHVNAMAGKPVSIHLSRADRIVPYEGAVVLAKAFKEAGAHVNLRENRWLGHYATIGVSHLGLSHKT